MAKRSRLRPLRDFVLPHRGNGFKPLLLTAGGVAAALLVIALVQGAYLLDTKLVFTKTNFLASVLPGTLAALTNDDRTDAGLGTLTPDPALDRVAQAKADDMAAHGYFAHVSPDGKTPWYWLKQAGYQYTYAGENLAVNFSDSEDVEEAWMASPAHHANIVKPQYTRIGIGVAEGEYQGKKTIFVAQFFATPPAAVNPKSVEEGKLAKAPAVPAKAPAEEKTETPVPSSPAADDAALAVAEAPVAETVLGAETDPARIAKTPSFLARVAASPNHMLAYMLAALAGLFSLLLAIAIGVHLRRQFLEVIGGGFLVILVALGVLLWNVASVVPVAVPADAHQSAQ
jgi:hypothetical protein